MHTNDQARFMVRVKSEAMKIRQWVEGYFNPYCAATNGSPIIERPSDIRGALDLDTICQCTGFQEYYHNEQGEIISGKYIYERDVVRITFRSGGAAEYLIWHSKEMNCPVALRMSELYFNGQDYGDEGPGQHSYGSFAFYMQDPWGDVDKVEVIGNEIDNPELFKDIDCYI